jgi:type I restriction enzyme M protein
VERTAQLLKEGGVAGIILPSSILSNTGIYTKTREIILQKFDIIAIAELGSNTFMATGTNTVVLFLRRKNDAKVEKVLETAQSVLASPKDITINGIEHAVSAYLTYGWNGLSVKDYATFLQKNPNKKVKKHPTYKEYRPREYTVEDLMGDDTSMLAREYAEKKVKQIEDAFWERVLKLESEKLFYFVLAYPQTIVLVKTGAKDAEKRFLGYEFSNRRGSEGIHPIERGKTIEDCTRLFDETNMDNPEKASAYIYKAFANDYDFPIHDSLKDNISRVRLADMLSFDRANFEKIISTTVQKKVRIESKWEEKRLDELVNFQNGLWKGEKGKLTKTKVLRNTNFKLNNGHLSYDDIAEIDVEAKQLENRKLEYGDIILEKSGGSETQAIGRVAIFDKKDNEIYSFSNFCSRIRVIDKKIIHPIYLWTVLNEFYNKGGTIPLQNGVRLLNIDFEGYKSIKIPFPTLSIQQKIVSEIEVVEKKEAEAREQIKQGKEQIEQIFIDAYHKASITYRFTDNNIFDVSIGKRVIEADLSGKGTIPVYSANVFVPFGYIDTLLITDFNIPSVIWGIDGDWMVNYMPSGKPFYPTDHCGVLRVRTKEIMPKYLAWVLKKTGAEQQFSRTLRASIDRIKGLSVKAPPLPEQQKIVSKIEKLEIKIQELQTQLEQFPIQKEQILKKYL